VIGVGLLLLSLPVQAGGEARREADESARRGDYAVALEQYRSCAVGSDAQARLCGSQAALLAPQAEDNFVGWAVLQAVRRDYRELGVGEARARVEAELQRRPDGPAGAELRAWLAHEQLRVGELPATPGLTAGDEAWVEEGAARLRQARRHALVAGVGGVAAAGRTLWMGGRAALKGALPAAVGGLCLLGLLPLLAAFPQEPDLARPLVVNAGWAMTALFFARSAPPLLGAVGTFGGFLALAGSHGWLDRMGVP
jgi:hypothetical protein